MKNLMLLARPVVPSMLLLMTVAASGELAAQETPALKIAVINVGRLLEESTVGQAALQELKGLQEQKGAEARGKEEQIKGLRDRLNEGRLSLSEERLAEMQKELEEEIIEYRRFQDDTQREFQKKQIEMFEDIQNKVMPIITDVGREFGFTLIFNKFESGLVFARDDIDVTDLILERFNAAMAEPAEEGAGG